MRTTSIQYKDTGVALGVTPSVDSGDMVTMAIDQAVTDVGAIDAATGQRAFLQRQFSSKVAVRSGEAVVLGGLIRENDTGGSSGVPGCTSAGAGRALRHQDELEEPHRAARRHHTARGAQRCRRARDQPRPAREAARPRAAPAAAAAGRSIAARPGDAQR
ncbi:hypothetical protein MASR1M6_27090 [Rubrivivax sp.]